MKFRVLFACLMTLALMLGSLHRVSAQTAKESPEPTRANRVDTPYRGGLVNPPQQKPRFTLTDTSGAAFDLRAKTQGYVTLLFFGYTHCPDMCPLQMNTIAQALKKVPIDIQDQYKIVFVTTDPARDTPGVIRAWLDHFDKRFIGLTGTEAAIEAAQVAANLPVAKKSLLRPDGAYEVGHAAFVMAYTRDNLAHVIYPVGEKQDDWAHDLPYLANETWSH